MSRFISLRILASLSKSKTTANRETPRTPPTAEAPVEPASREEPQSSSRISVNRIRVEG